MLTRPRPIKDQIIELFSWRTIILSDLGELYTWGKGRYGRLGHGDSEDQTKPKLVEALLGYRVIDVACGTFIYYFIKKNECRDTPQCGN